MQSSSYIAVLIETLRPKHWIKNSFILAPALFAGRILDSYVWADLLAGFFGFSFIASAIYAFNDVCNRSEDRLHPTKKHRPVASGRISMSSAMGLTVISAAVGTVFLFFAGLPALIYAVVYAFAMILYTLLLRRILLVDIIVIAVGFVLRIMIGGAIVAEPVSHWLLLCTFTIALFLAMIKRRQEIVGLAAAGTGSEKPRTASRAVLDEYPPIAVLDGWINVLTGMTIICYALYTVDPQTIAIHHTEALIYSLPFVLYGVFRYQKLALTDAGGEDPTGLILGDNGIRLALLFWILTVGSILYFSGNSAVL